MKIPTFQVVFLMISKVYVRFLYVRGVDGMGIFAAPHPQPLPARREGSLFFIGWAGF